MTPAEAERWGKAGGGSTKYYKGLGTSTAVEAKEYFEALPHHRTQFTWGGAPDAEAIDLAFGMGQGRTEDRKEWLADAKHQIAQGTFGPPVDPATTGAAGPTAAAVAAAAAERGAAGAAGGATGGAAPDAGAPAPPALEMAELKKMQKPALAALMAEHGLSAVRGDGRKLPVAEMRKLLAGGAAAAATPAAPTLASGACREDRTYSQFVHEELVHFSLADNRRSLPSLIDGLKPSQRKALHACFEKKLFAPAELKVQALASYTSETLDYKHGEAALIETIKKMAQATFTQPQPQPQP